MSKNSEFLIDKIFEKLKKLPDKKISLEKDEFKKFIYFLINNR